MAEQIKVEWITSQAQVVQALDKLNRKIDEVGKTSERMSAKTKKGADDAVGSFARLEKELKDNEKALKRLAMGSDEFRKQKTKVDQLRASLAKAKGQIASSQSQIGSVFRSGIVKLGGLAAGMASFQSLLNSVVGELEKAKELRIEAAGTSRTFEQAIVDIGENIGADAIPQARQLLLDRAPGLGVDNLDGFANVLGVAVSAGAKDVQEAMRVAAAALKTTGGDTARAAIKVGGALDVAKLAGSTNFEGALGQLQQVQSQVRATNPAEFGKNIGPGLAAATLDGANVKGVSTERAFEVGSVISQIILDQTGANTATTMRQLFSRLDSFVPKEASTLSDGTQATVAPDQITAFRNADTFDERLSLMRTVPAIAKQFLETQRESVGKSAVRAIVTGDASAMSLEKKAADAITSIDSAQTDFKKLVRQLESQTPLLRAERQNQASLQVGAVEGSRAVVGQVDKIVTDVINKVDLSGLDAETSTALRADFERKLATGVNPVQAGQETLQRAGQQRTLFGLIPAGGEVSDEDKTAILNGMKALQIIQVQLEAAQNRPVVVQVKQDQRVNAVPASQVP